MHSKVEKLENFKKNIYAKFAPLLSARQIDAIGSSSIISRWEESEILSALHIRYCSKSAYKILKGILPLPSFSTLKRWVAKIECKPGYQETVLQLLKMKSTNFLNLDKLCVISFDEMEVSKKICYNPSYDATFGPFSKVQVVLIRGLCSKWKRALFFDFDFKFSKASFIELVLKIQNCNLFPIAVVCDFSPLNRKLLKELNISYESPSMKEENFENPLYFFADFPHMLKLLRNHFLDSGIILKSGTRVERPLVDKILTMQNSDLKLCHKLTVHHLSVKGTDRQNVRKAAQIFSASVANFIRIFLPGNEESANFMLLINNLFDIFNSVKEFEKNEKKAAFTGSIEQISLLAVAYEEIFNLRTGKNPRTQKLPFQNGMLQSINSLQLLFRHLKNKYELRYILTYKLTQDTLENFFCQIRALGRWYDNPSPIEFIFRFRLLILSKNIENIRFSKHLERPKLDENFISIEIGKYTDCINSAALNSSVNLAHISPIEQQALYYLTGYVAFKCRNIISCKYALGYDISTLNACNLPSAALWLNTVNRGKLCHPSPRFWAQVQELEKEFLAYFSTSSVFHLKAMISSLSLRHPDIPSRLLSTFLRCRMFFKLRSANQVKSIRTRAHKISKFVS